MKKFKQYLKKYLMIILFLAALQATYYHLTGVTAIDLIRSIGINGIHDNQLKQWASVLQVKKVTATSLEEDMAISKTLEEVVNKGQYETIQVIATGYTAGYESTGKYPNHPSYGITFSGVKVTRDLYSTIAADLDVFPIGTILFIPEYGYGVVADTGSAIKGNKLDLYYDTVQDVYEQWGKKSVDVYVIKKGNGKLSEEYLRALNEDENMQVFRQQFTNKQKK